MRQSLVAVAIAALVAVGTAAGRPALLDRPAADCSRISVGLDALPDLGTGLYRGYQGGLYPGGANRPPDAYLAEGIAARDLVQPVNGRIVLLSIGMSNTTQEYSQFMLHANRDVYRNPQLTLVDGAQGGQDAERIRDPNAPFWNVVDQRLAGAGATRDQVQAVWLKQAIAGENRVFPADANRLRDALRDIVGILRNRFQNLRLVYVSSRTYAGYASTGLNPEPHAYHSGFAVKWLIEEHIADPPSRPWVGWGPYLWTDGLRGRADGLVWECADTTSDGTHPSISGRQKVAGLLLDFFANEPTARKWFLRRGL